jgi:hypothetical protein
MLEPGRLGRFLRAHPGNQSHSEPGSLARWHSVVSRAPRRTPSARRHRCRETCPIGRAKLILVSTHWRGHRGAARSFSSAGSLSSLMLPLPLAQFPGEARAFLRLLGGDDDRRHQCPWRCKRGASGGSLQYSASELRLRSSGLDTRRAQTCLGIPTRNIATRGHAPEIRPAR